MIKAPYIFRLPKGNFDVIGFFQDSFRVKVKSI